MGPNDGGEPDRCLPGVQVRSSPHAQTGIRRHRQCRLRGRAESMPNKAAYCANKAGVIGLTRQMALQYARQGVRVTAVSPGATLTPFAPRRIDKNWQPGSSGGCFLGAHADRAARLRPEEIANAIAYLASDEASFITGSILDVDGGSNLVTAHVAPGSY